MRSRCSGKLVSVFLIAAMVLIAGLLFTACGGGGGSDTGGTSTSGGGEGEEASTPSAEVPKELTIAFNQQITTLDPDQVIGNADLNALHQIGGGLYEQRGEGEIVPLLAEKATTSPDQLTWTFKLRSDVKFSDGTPVTAADVEATFDRAFADEANINGAVIGPMESVKAKGAHEVVFKVERPYPSLPAVLSESGFIIMPKAGLAEGKAFFNHPISFGPYELVSWQGPNAEFALNKYYVGPEPVVPALHFRTVADPSSRIAQLRSGQLDYSFDIPPSLIPTLANDDEIHTEVVPSYGWYSLSMWNAKPPLNDVNVRKAVSLAIDRDKLAEIVWGGENEPVAGYWPPTMKGYDPSIPTTANDEEAEKLLQGTECASGCKLKLTYSPAITPWAEQAALLIADDLGKIGIDVTLVKDEGTTFVTDLFEGNYQLGLYGLADFIPEPDGLLPYGLSINGGVNSNFTGYHKASTEKLITETLSASGAERERLLKEVNEVFLRDQPFATLVTWAYVSASRVPSDVIKNQPSLQFEIGRKPEGG